MTPCTDRELGILAHACAWNHPRSPLYRNAYATSPDADSWATCQALAGRGLMVATHSATPRGMSFFRVTDAGLAVLREQVPRVRVKRGRGGAKGVR